MSASVTNMKPPFRLILGSILTMATLALGDAPPEADALTMSAASVVPSTLQENTLIPGTLTITFTPSIGSAELLILLPGFSFTSPTSAGVAAYSSGMCGSTAVGATVSGASIVAGQCSATVVGGVSQFFLDLGTPAIAGDPVTVVFAGSSLTSPASGSLTTITPQFMNGATVVDTINLTVLLTAPTPPAPLPDPLLPADPTLPNTGSSDPMAFMPLGASFVFVGAITLLALRRRAGSDMTVRCDGAM